MSTYRNGTSFPPRFSNFVVEPRLEDPPFFSIGKLSMSTVVTMENDGKLDGKLWKNSGFMGKLDGKRWKNSGKLWKTRWKTMEELDWAMASIAGDITRGYLV